MYDFDRIIKRTGTNSLKYDFIKERMGRDDLLPLWVADMDFALPPEVLEPLQERVAHGIFGYSDPKEPYYKALSGWYERHHHWSINRRWNTVVPGVVYGIAQAILALTKPEDAILIMQPVYYPFSEVIQDNNRKLINSELVFDGAKYHIDFEDFERKITEHEVKMLLLCNPHNPVGRVWTLEELQRIDEITRRHNVVVFSDEIHGDFTFPGYEYTPYATVSEEAAMNAVIGTSPSKTFNIAGLQISNIIIPNPTLRKAYRHAVAGSGYSQGNTMGLLAGELVYERGDDWYGELLAYLDGNLSFIRDYLRTNLPSLQLVEPEGTYLIWINFKGLGLSDKQLEQLIVDRAHLFLDAGAIFGAESAQFYRFNIACPRSILQQAFAQLSEAIDSL